MSPTRPRQTTQRIIRGDCLKVMADMEPDSVDLIFGSPPYEDARTYGIDFKLKGQDWVDWMVRICEEASRVSKGLVAFVVQGRTRKFKWSCTPVLLMADLHRAGFNVREPIYYHRSGIPGSGGPDDMRHDLEYVVRVSKPGRLVWSDNVACGEPCKYAEGGMPSHRTQTGDRVNVTDPKSGHTLTSKRTSGRLVSHRDNNDKYSPRIYQNPKIANPGNVIKCRVGGGALGSKLAHENEAPFPEKLAEFFIKSFCPPGGIVLDPFSGSGTTIAVAKKCYRSGIGIDVRESQIELGHKRLEEK